MIVITKDMVVSMRYVMKNSRGEVLEDTMNTAPTSYLHGSTAIAPSLQKQLEGMQAGERRRVFLAQEDRGADDDFTFDVVIAALREALPEEILLGYPVIPGDVICDADCECFKMKVS